MSTPGMPPASEPVAMTIAFVESSCAAPSAAVTFTLPGARIVPSPIIPSTSFFFSRKATPLTLAATVSSLCFISAA